MQNELNTLFEDIEPEGSKKVAVVVGRFNPPTKGHYHVFNVAKKFIKSHKDLGLEALPVVIVIAGSKSDQDKKKNPLSGDERIKFMEASGKANGIVFLTAKTAFEAFTNLRKLDYEPIAIAAGEERSSDYMRILDNYFKDKQGREIKHYEIELPRKESAIGSSDEAKKNILEKMRDGADPDVDEISGSLAKLAVKLGYKEEFTKIVDLEHNESLANEMYNKIKKSFGES